MISRSYSVLLVLLITILLSACSVVKKNGYKQSRDYRPGKEISKVFSKKENHRKNQFNETEPWELTEAVALVHKGYFPVSEAFEPPQEANDSTTLKCLIKHQHKQLNVFNRSSLPLTKLLLSRNTSIIEVDTFSHGNETLQGRNYHPGIFDAFLLGIITIVITVVTLLSEEIFLFFIGPILGVLTLIKLYKTLSEIKQNPEKYRGKRLTKIMLVIGFFLLALMLTLIASFMEIL